MVIVLGLAGPSPSAEAADPGTGSDGRSEGTAAASCWEIKQDDPASPDGVYWLLTPAMTQAEQFYCDQTRSGGGWVLVGRGREGWSNAYIGSGTPQQVRAEVTGPAAFTPRQLSADMIDSLNNDEPIASLDDGVRLVRAKDQQGTSFQDLTFTFRDPRDQWTWMFDSVQRVDAYTIDGTRHSGNGAATSSFGNDESYRRVRTTTGANEGWMQGFGFGSNVSGSTGDSSYLWSRTSNSGNARPFTQVFVRPKLRSTDIFEQIPDSGTPQKVGVAVASAFALPQTWGVAGLGAGPTTLEGSNEVSAFTEVGNTVFVGGNFTSAQRSAGGAGKVSQSYLAAFDRDSGEFRSGFSPTFDNQVKALATLPGGRIAVGGYFSQVNGSPHAGLVVLDATTGQVDEQFTGRLVNHLSGGVTAVRALDVQGNWLYAAGTFTHSSGGKQSSEVYTRSAARFTVDDGTPDADFNPEFNGGVMSLDASEQGDRVYYAGFFSQTKGRTAEKAAALTTDGVDLLPWDVVFSNRGSGRSGYQQAVLEVGDRVWLGGSEHSLMSYDRSGLTMLSSSIGRTGGDFQAIATDGNAVYGGCHCFENQYDGATQWPNVGTTWTASNHIYGSGAWSASTGRRLPSFNGDYNTRAGAGAWALFVDSTGTLWQGGDWSYSTRNGYQRQWSGGFLRNPQEDTKAPSTPSGAKAVNTSEGVKVSWGTATDNVAVTGYQVLRDDRVITTTSDLQAMLPTAPTDARYFVRAIDARGNASASTAVFHSSEMTDPPGTSTLVGPGATWEYQYDGSAPASGWTDAAFDASSWATGTAPLGWGQAIIGTPLSSAATPKPLVSFYRRTFDVQDASKIASIKLATRADDGVVISLNGTEIGRKNVDPGDVGAGTYANTAVSAASAIANPVEMTAPGYLVHDGKNVITVSVHSNYRSTPSHSFDLEAIATMGTQPDPPDEPLPPVLPAEASWQYRFENAAPPDDWAQEDFTADWPTGTGPIGWGQPDLETPLDTSLSPRPITSYYRQTFSLETLDFDQLRLTARVDDGIIVYVNGTEVHRENLGDGNVSSGTYANRAVSASVARSTPITIDVPVSALHTGKNTVAVEVHSNYRSTPSHSFTLSGKEI